MEINWSNHRANLADELLFALRMSAFYSPTIIMCLYCGDTKYNTSADTQPVINMPNIVDGLPKNIMVNYCDKK